MSPAPGTRMGWSLSSVAALIKDLWEAGNMLLAAFAGGVAILGILLTILMLLWKIAQWAWT